MSIQDACETANKELQFARENARASQGGQYFSDMAVVGAWQYAVHIIGQIDVRKEND